MAIHSSLPRFGVVLNSLEGKYQSDLLRGILTGLGERAHALIIVVRELSGDPERERERLVAHLPDRGLVDGIIVLSSALRLQASDVLAIGDHFRHDDGSTRIVSIGLRVSGVPSILVNDEAGVRASVEHLISPPHSCKEIGFIRGPAVNEEAERRFKAFRETLLSQGNYEEQFVSEPGQFTVDWGLAAAEQLLGAWPKLHALVAASDDIARGALAFVNRKYAKGSRPAVIGFDDTALAVGTEPPLTTVRQPLEVEGELAARWLLRLHQGKKVRSFVKLSTALHVRESCGCPLGASHGPSQVDAWLSHLAPDARTAARLRRTLQADTDTSARMHVLEMEVERLVSARETRATSSDTGAVRHALAGLRDAALNELPAGEAISQTVYRFWQLQLDKVATLGSRLALQSESRRGAVRNLRETTTEEPDEFSRLLSALDLAEHWICVPRGDGTDPGRLLVLAGTSDAAMEVPNGALLPSAALPPTTICYGLDLGSLRGRLVFALGAANDWWSYGDLRAATEAFCKRRLNLESAHPPRADAVLPFPADGPAHSQNLLKIKDRLGQLFARLDSAVRPRSASLQLIDGDMRMLVWRHRIHTESRSLLRPISCDALVSRLLRDRQAEYAADTNQLADWQVIQGIGAWIGAPIFDASNKPIGLLTVDFSEPILDIEKYRKAIEGLLGDAKALLINGRELFHEEQLIERTHLVKVTMDLVAKKLEPKELLQTIVDEVARLINCSHCTVFFPRKIGDETLLVAEYASFGATLSRRFKLNEAIAGYVWQTRETVLITDAHSDKRYKPSRRKPQEDVEPEKRSMLVVPIIAGDQIIGVISADQDAIGWFQERDARLVEALAQQAGIAIQRSHAIRFVQEIAGRILAADSSRDILERVVAAAVQLANADAGVIYLFSDGDKLAVREAYPPTSGHPQPRLENESGLTRRIIRERDHIAIADLSDPKWGANPELSRLGYKSLLGVPLIDEDVIGVLFIDDKDPHVFNDTEVSLLRILTGLAAIALQRTTRSQGAERARLPPMGGSVGELLRAEVSTCVYLWDSESEVFRSPQADGPLKTVLELPPRANGTGRRVVDSGEPIFQPDVRQPPTGSPPVRGEAIQGGLKSFAALPLRHDDRIVGAMFIASQDPIEFNEGQRNLLTVFARHIAPATAHAARYERQKKVAHRVAVRMNQHMKGYDLSVRELAACANSPRQHTIEEIQSRLFKTTVLFKRLLSEFERDGREVVLDKGLSSLNQLLKSVHEESRHFLVSGAVPRLELDRSLDDPIELDSFRIADCLRRLLSNADREVARSPSPPEIILFSRADLDGYAAFGVQDNGGGFPEGIEPKAPFEGLDPERLGLGLSVVHGIAQAHGGRLDCGRSQTLAGALVTVRIPIRRSVDA